MARVILDVPTEKFGSFMSLVKKLGLGKHAIESKMNEPTFSATVKRWTSSLSQKMNLGWEANCNELEFE